MIRAKDGFWIEKMMDGYLIVATGKSAESFNAMIQTNETGAFYWRMIEKGTTTEELVQAAMERFEDLEETVARQDIGEFLESISPAIEQTDEKEDEL